MDAAAMEFMTGGAASSAASLLLKLAAEAPASYFYLGTLLVFFVFLYNLLEFHVVGDLLLRGCRGDRVSLTFNPASELCQHVVSRCRALHRRYLVTPWLASPHIQTAFLHFFGNPPSFAYRRQVIPVSEAEDVALDWLLPSDVAGHQNPGDTKNIISRDDTVPIVVVVPGLVSDSACAYVRHLVLKIAKRGWNAVVANHRGMGGITLKSECYYNAGLTDDIREVIKHLHQEYPRAPLFVVGTSMGANILVKYLGEEGENTPVTGAASICCPWDLVVCDRFLDRNSVQQVYHKALAFGLKDYAKLNQTSYSKVVDWEGIRKSNSLRDFFTNSTCLIMNYETVDTYYRHASCVSVVSNVSVPLLCVSALDDPVCTKEVIPWDECRANKNILLATTPHGGHLAFFEGLAAGSLWWVEAVDEFLGVLHSSPYMRGERKMPPTGLDSAQESALCKSSHGSGIQDVKMMVMANEGANADSDDKYPDSDQAAVVLQSVVNSIAGTEQQQQQEGEEKEASKEVVQEKGAESPAQKAGGERDAGGLRRGKGFSERRPRNQVSRRSGGSIWMLAYIAAVTTWPLVGPVLFMVFKRKFRNAFPATLLGR